MADLENIMKLVVLTLFSIYLYSKHCQRVRSRTFQPRQYAPGEQVGEAIDTTKLQPTVENVRHNYLAARQRARSTFLRRRLLGLARSSISRLSFFHGRELEEHAQTHGH